MPSSLPSPIRMLRNGLGFHDHGTVLGDATYVCFAPPEILQMFYYYSQHREEETEEERSRHWRESRGQQVAEPGFGVTPRPRYGLSRAVCVPLPRGASMAGTCHLESRVGVGSSPRSGAHSALMSIC